MQAGLLVSQSIERHITLKGLDGDLEAGHIFSLLFYCFVCLCIQTGGSWPTGETGEVGWMGWAGLGWAGLPPVVVVDRLKPGSAADEALSAGSSVSLVCRYRGWPTSLTLTLPLRDGNGGGR